MNEELTDKLQGALVGLIDSATSAAAFVADEIPEVLEQLLMWKMAFNGMATVSSVGCFAFCPSSLLLFPYVHLVPFCKFGSLLRFT